MKGAFRTQPSNHNVIFIKAWRAGEKSRGWKETFFTTSQPTAGSLNRLPSDYSTGNPGGASPFLTPIRGTVGAGATIRPGK